MKPARCSLYEDDIEIREDGEPRSYPTIHPVYDQRSVQIQKEDGTGSATDQISGGWSLDREASLLDGRAFLRWRQYDSKFFSPAWSSVVCWEFTWTAPLHLGHTCRTECIFFEPCPDQHQYRHCAAYCQRELTACPVGAESPRTYNHHNRLTTLSPQRVPFCGGHQEDRDSWQCEDGPDRLFIVINIVYSLQRYISNV